MMEAEFTIIDQVNLQGFTLADELQTLEESLHLPQLTLCKCTNDRKRLIVISALVEGLGL